MSQPSDYDPKQIKDYVSSVISDTDNKNNIDDDYTKPNIICIMNESLSDLKVLGNLETNEDYMPFMRSLTKTQLRATFMFR